MAPGKRQRVLESGDNSRAKLVTHLIAQGLGETHTPRRTAEYERGGRDSRSASPELCTQYSEVGSNNSLGSDVLAFESDLLYQA